MTDDNWGLKSLFHFDDNHWKIKNDTQEVVIIKNMEGREHQLAPDAIITFTPDDYSIVLPNNKIIKYSDKSSISSEDFEDNFSVIIRHLVKRLQDGHIIDGLEFLDYHYKWTRNKKRFLTFIKHYVLTIGWTTQKDKIETQIEAVRDWVDEKKKGRKRPIYVFLLTVPIIVYTIGLIVSTDYKEIFIGALIGGIASPLKEIHDLLIDD